jgi:hypothetical protein
LLLLVADGPVTLKQLLPLVKVDFVVLLAYDDLIVVAILVLQNNPKHFVLSILN